MFDHLFTMIFKLSKNNKVNRINIKRLVFYEYYKNKTFLIFTINKKCYHLYFSKIQLYDMVIKDKTF